jgi:aldose sugar dehydrogenase
MMTGWSRRGVVGLAVLGALALPEVSPAQEVVEARVNSEYQPFRLVRVAGGLQTPWAVGFLPDGRFLVTERPGRLRLIGADGRIHTVSGLPADMHVQNQGGLLDVVVHPQFASNGWVYLTYSRGDSTGTATALLRARLDGERLVDHELLFEQNRRSQPGGHYGSRIVFLGDGTLLMSIGDRMREPERAQAIDDHAGSVLRLNENGTPATSNPFAGNPAYAPEIFSYGHRNVQGLVRHPLTGMIWATDHGPRGSDELQLVQPGRNYGWPAVTLGRDYRTQRQFGDSERRDARFTPPVFEFLPTLAPSGLAVVQGGGWHETWQNNLLVGGLRAQRILRLVIENDEVVHAEELLLHRVGRIRDVRQGPDGHIYVVTDERDGGLYRMEALPRQ